MPTPALGSTASRAREEMSNLLETGVFAPGQKLPGERDLAKRLGVSRTMLRQALAALADQKRVENFPSRGWFVSAKRMADSALLRSFTEMARARGLTPGARLVRRETRTVTLQEATSLALAPASHVHEFHRVRTLNGVVICYDVSIVPLTRFPQIEQVSLTDTSLYALLEDSYDARVIRTDYVIRAAAAPADVAEQLGVAKGSPVLVGEETAFDIAGVPMLLGTVTYRHDSYEFQATLWRSSNGASA